MVIARSSGVDNDAIRKGAALDSHAEIRVLLGYQGGLHRRLLAAALSDDADLTVVAELSRTDTVTTLAWRLRPTVAVLDITLPGTVAVTELCGTLTACQVLVVLDRRSGAATARSLARLAPRVGLIGTETTPTDLIKDIRRLAHGETVLDPELALAAIRSTTTELTNRERDVLQMTRQGATTPEIATRLYLSAGTVRNHLSKILTKTGARNRIDALRVAHDAGWI